MNNFSIIIPAYNEGNNLNLLLDEILKNCKLINFYEIIIIDDKSNDDTQKILQDRNEKNLNIITNNHNEGQSFSIYKGIKASKYDNIITLDADLQNDPKDIPHLVSLYSLNKNTKLVSGIRKNRKDNLLKILSSKVANFVRSIILKDKCPDTGCSLKVFDKNYFLEIPYFNGMHRFIPAFFVGMKCNVIYEPVNHRYRKYGKSNYSTFQRLFKGILDLYKVKKMIKEINTND